MDKPSHPAKNRFIRELVIAEGFGTYALVLAGTLAAILKPEIGHVGVALTFGLVVFTLIRCLGPISGCHINPAVTIGLYLAGKIRGTLVVPYLSAQFVGAILASTTVKFFVSVPSWNIKDLGVTHPQIGITSSFLLEAMLTFFLMFVILRTLRETTESQGMQALTIGAVIGLEAMFAGPLTGASMNPARSLAPAILSFKLDSVWLYLFAPTLGGWLAVLFDKSIDSASISQDPTI